MLSRVIISSNVFFSCTLHAHSSEKEEVMGLLLGETAVGAHGMGFSFSN